MPKAAHGSSGCQRCCFAGDWSYGYFAFNVILAIIWGMISSVLLIFMPIWESRKVKL